MSRDAAPNDEHLAPKTRRLRAERLRQRLRDAGLVTFRPYGQLPTEAVRVPQLLDWNEPQRKCKAPELRHKCSGACKPRAHV